MVVTPPESALNVLASAYEQILDATVETYDGVIGTPRRAARAWLEFMSGYDEDVAGLFTRFPADGYSQMIAVTNVPFTSLCEHHLLPFTGRAHIVYLPDEQIVGLSKIPRLVHAFARRLQIQERLTDQVATALWEHLDPLGVVVMVEATHSCMVLRGVKSTGEMRTTALRGVFKNDPAARAEAYSMIDRG